MSNMHATPPRLQLCSTHGARARVCDLRAQCGVACVC
eukprot:COSAG02_NODE_1868_length_10593_cov_8.279648_1_plen_36_part_10